MSGGSDTPEKQRQGQQAIQNGKALENDLARKFAEQLGYEQARTVPTLPTILADRAYFVRECKGLVRNVVGGPMSLDFYLHHPTKHPDGFVIEAKYQERGGSIDEKLYFTVNSLLRIKIPSLLLLLGHGYKQPIYRWCLQQHHPGTLWVVADWADLLRMVNGGFF
jgi:hypothetical protein